MLIHLTLYGLMRDLLPREARGKTTLEIPEGESVSFIIENLGIHGTAVFAVNGEVERDSKRVLKDGDRVNIFRPAGGG